MATDTKRALSGTLITKPTVMAAYYVTIIQMRRGYTL